MVMGCPFWFRRMPWLTGFPPLAGAGLGATMFPLLLEFPIVNFVFLVPYPDFRLMVERDLGRTGTIR